MTSRRTLFVRRSFITTILILAGGASLMAQEKGQSEAQLRIELERALINEAVARQGLARKAVLAHEGLVAKADAEIAAAEVRRAELDTLKARITLSNELPMFRIVSATKSADPKGSLTVKLYLLELPHAYNEGERLYLVSLRGPSTIISEPYQASVVLRGKDSQHRMLSFRLLKDVDEVTVLIASGTRHEEIPILLQRGHGDQQIVVRAQNFSQEAALGDKADYALDLERFASGTREVRLVVRGLPDEMTYEWIEATTKAKLSSFQFVNDQNTAHVILRVYVPAQANPLWFGRVITFHAEVRDADQLGGAADLQLRPVGAPKLFLTADNLLINLSRGERQTIAITVENSGGVAARDVTIDANVPLGFEARLEPRMIGLIDAGQKVHVGLIITASASAVPGEYNLKLNASATTKLANVESPEQSFRIILRGSQSWMVLGLGVPLLLTAGIAVWFVGRRRRDARR
jgi:NPCBM-associated, NEW3 domain of alpha-galactosidase